MGRGAAIRSLFATLGLVLTFLLSVVLGVRLHLDTAPLRRSLAARVTGLLASTVKGRLEIVSIRHVGLEGVDEVDVRIFDPAGVPAASAYGVRARAQVLDIARSVLEGTGAIAIDLTEVSVRAIDLDVTVDEDGTLGVERAFAPRAPSTPGGRAARLAIDRIDVGHAWLHGRPARGLPIDADIDALDARLLVDAPRLSVAVTRARLTTRAMPYGADVRGTLEGSLVLPAPSGGPLGARLAWQGTIAGIAGSVTGSVDGDAIEAVVDAPVVAPASVRALWPASPIELPASVHAEAWGTLPRIEVSAKSTLGDSSIEVAGPIVLAAGQTADLHFDARAIDIHTIAASAPASHLGATGELSVARSAGGNVAGKATIEFAGGHVAQQSVPAATIKATFAQDPRGPRLDATVSAREPGAPTALTLHLAPKGRSVELTFDADTRVQRLDAVSRLGGRARGRSVLKTHGQIDFDRGAMNVRVEAEVDDLGRDVVHVEHASITAEARGPLRSPQIDVTVHGNILDVGGYRFSAAHVEVHGPLTQAHVNADLDADGDGTPDLDAEGELEVVDGVALDEVRVRIGDRAERVHVRVGSVRLAHGQLTIEPVVVEGLGGTLEGSVHSSPTEVQVRAKGEGIDLARLGRVARVERGLQGCLLALDVDVAAKRAGADGHASFELSKCTLGRVQGASGGLEATIQGRRIAGRAHAELEDVGSLVVTTMKSGIEFGARGPLQASGWKDAWGKVRFDGKIDLEKLAAHLPRPSVPFDEVRGTLSLSGRVERDSAVDDTPGFTLAAATSGLLLVGPSKRATGADGKAVIVPPAWRLDGIDGGLDVRVDPDTGFLALAARVNDKNGELAALDLKSSGVPYEAMLATPNGALALLEAAPFNAHLVVPARDMKTLPPILALRGLRGELDADVVVAGTVAVPTVDLTARVTGGHAPVGFSSLLDLNLTAHYDGTHGTATLLGRANGDPVISVGLDGDVRMADLLAGQTGAWDASLRAHMTALPLEDLTPLSDRQIVGRASGDFTVEGLHRNASAILSLDVLGLRVGDVAYRLASVKGTLDGTVFDALAHLEQEDGSLDATAHAGSKWGAALVPSFDPTKPLYGQLTAKHFRGAILLPFVDNTFTELDGRLDADLHITLDPGTRSSRMQGVVAVTEGRFELAAVGGEFHDASAKATFTPDGAVKIEGIKASGMSGRIEAAASARFRGLAFAAANATVQIPSSSPLLLTVEGAQVGTVEGRVDVAASRSPDGNALEVKVDVPTLHVGLPLTSSRDIQQLGPLEGVRIGKTSETGATGATDATKNEPAFVEERLDAPHQAVAAPAGKTLRIAVNLGNDVLIKKGTTLKVALDGHPTILVTDAVRASGQIRILSGIIDVQGKSFNIENGTITFVGDLTNPQVVVTASWGAPDGTVVYADFVGPLKSGKVNLRSEPSLPKNEILALILFGTPDGLTAGSQGAPSGSVGAGVAGGAATQPLNRALENFGLAGVSTRVDTSGTTPRADVEVQIARDISLQIAQVMGTPPPGTNPDVTLFTLSWRFIRQWSAETTIGTAGTSILDLVWQYRY